MVYDKILTGQRIRERREELGLSTEEVAAELEVDEEYYQEIENDTRSMSLELFVVLTSFLGISMDGVIHGKKYGLAPGLTDEQQVIWLLNQCSEKSKAWLLELLSDFVNAIADLNPEK